MKAAEVPHAIAGCDLTLLDSPACEQYVSWLLGEKRAISPEQAAGFVWALAHCDDGVTWGRYDADATAWRLGNHVAPGVSPPVRLETMQELRLFGEGGEVLVWRTEAGLRGRILRETDPPADCDDEADPLRPSNEPRVIRGTRVIAQCRHGFTHIGDGTGAEQVIPIGVTEGHLKAAGVRLYVRHYFEFDPDIGTVGIAATRLVNLMSGGNHAT